MSSYLRRGISFGVARGYEPDILRKVRKLRKSLIDADVKLDIESADLLSTVMDILEEQSEEE